MLLKTTTSKRFWGLLALLLLQSTVVLSQNEPYITDFVVNDDILNYSQWEPHMTGFPGKGFQIVWRDNRAVTDHYFIRRFSSMAFPYGMDQQCTFTQESWLERNLKLIENSSGESLVLWENHRHYYSEIWHRPYDSVGMAIGSAVATDELFTLSGNQTQPDAAYFSNRSSLVVWVDDRDTTLQVWGRFFDELMAPLSSAMKLSNNDSGNVIRNPVVTALDSSRYVLAWISRNAGTSRDRIFIRSASFGMDSNATVSLLYEAPVGTTVSDITLRSQSPGSFLLSRSEIQGDQRALRFALFDSTLSPLFPAWTALQSPDLSTNAIYSADYSADHEISVVHDSTDGVVHLHRFTESGTVIPITIDFNPEHEDQLMLSPCISAIHDSLRVAWVGVDSLGHRDIFTRVFLTDGTPVSPRIRVNTDFSRQDQENPDVRVLPGNQLLFVYSDARFGTPAPYMVLYDSLGRCIMNSRPVPSDTSYVYRQWTPAMDANSSGQFVVAWRDERENNPDVYFRMFNSPRMPITNDIMANGQAPLAFQRFPDVAIDNAGRVIIVWSDGRFDEDDIYVRVFSAAGVPMSPELPIDEIGGNHYTEISPQVSMIAPDVAMIVWEDDRNGNLDIFGRYWSTATGLPIGMSFRVNDDTGIGRQEIPTVAGDRIGHAVVAYSDDHSQTIRTDIYLRYYTMAGPTDSAFCASLFDHPREHSDIAVALDSTGRTAVCWRDRGQIEPEIFAVELAGNLNWTTPVPYQVNGNALGEQRTPTITFIPSGSIVYAWCDDRNGMQTGKDIMCNIRLWAASVDITRDPDHPIPESFALSSAFPNPFNASTKFTLALASHDDITISVYDLLGRHVTDIFSGDLIAGQYNFSWNGVASDGNNVASGMYLLRVAGHEINQTRKLLLLK